MTMLTRTKINVNIITIIGIAMILLGGMTLAGLIATKGSAVNGTCGTAQKAYSTVQTSWGAITKATFCKTGTAVPLMPIFPVIGQTSNWMCNGSNGGADTKCGTYRVPPVATDASIKSEFLKNNSTAIKIMKGENYFYSTNTSFYEVSSFEFKLMNAFKQLGFSKLIHSDVGQSPPSTVVNRFRKIYNIKPSDYLDKTTLMLLDNELAQRESKDRKYAAIYPPFPKFINGPLNEPPKEHIGMLFAQFFGSLPKNIQTNAIGQNNVWQIKEFRNSLAWGLSGNLGKFLDETGTRELNTQEGIFLATNDQENFMYCNDIYYAANLQNDCLTPVSLTTALPDDINYMTMIAHEFGHAVSTGTHVNNSPFDVAFLFGNISYVMSPANPNGIVVIKKRKDNNDEFISRYAKTSQFEDFAESFSSYIFIGKIFRKRIKSNIYLKQKYNFLKTVIFKGREFDTGSLSSFNIWNLKNKEIPFHSEDYLNEDPNWRWDYKYNTIN